MRRGKQAELPGELQQSEIMWYIWSLHRLKYNSEEVVNLGEKIYIDV